MSAVNQERLFDTNVCASDEVLESMFKELNPFTRQCFTHWYGDTLDLFLKSFANLYDTDDPIALLNQLDKVITHEHGRLRVNLTSEALYKKSIRTQLGRLDTKGRTPTLNRIGLNLGTIGHNMMRKLFEGRKHASGNVQPSYQLQFWSNNDEDLGASIEVWDGRSLSVDFIEKIKASLNSVDQTVNGYPWEVGAAKAWQELRELENIMKMFAPVEIRQARAFAKISPEAELLYLYSLKCWASGLEQLNEWVDGKISLGTELSLVGNASGISLGRIDAALMKGSKKSTSILAQLPGFERPHALPLKTIDALISLFHELNPNSSDIVGLIADAKMSVGDGIDGATKITEESVNEKPMSRHETQVTRYLAVARELQKILESRKGNSSQPFFGLGYIIYFLEKGLKIHELTLDEDSAQRILQNIAGNLSFAESHLAVGAMANKVVAHITKERTRLSQPLLFEIPDSRPHRLADRSTGTRNLHPIVRALQSRRTFLDPLNIAEVVGEKNGEPLIIIHANRFFSNVETGNIKVVGRKVACFYHKPDRHPSAQIYKDRIHCFVCNRGFPLTWDGVIPENVVFRRGARRIIIKDKAPDLSGLDVHESVLKTAQSVLKKAFRNSTGSRYIDKVRGIDPDFAALYGIGYGNKLVARMLNEGIPYQDIVRAGLVTFRNYDTNRSLVAYLREKHGMAEDEIIKKVKQGDKIVIKFPYDMLQNRLTAPLELFGGRLTSIYGRHILDEKPLHIKLSTEYSGIPQGGFNMDVLNETNSAHTVLIFESVLDALTFEFQKALERSWSGFSAVSFIGTGNQHIAEEVASSGKAVGAVLDNDFWGKHHAKKFIETFSKIRGENAEIRDYLSVFSETYPGFADADDLNKWWIRQGKDWITRQIREKIVVGLESMLK